VQVVNHGVAQDRRWSVHSGTPAGGEAPLLLRRPEQAVPGWPPAPPTTTGKLSPHWPGKAGEVQVQQLAGTLFRLIAGGAAWGSTVTSSRAR